MSCRNTPVPAPRRDLIVLLIFALAVNLLAARFVARPGYMDAYYYFGGALQLVRGRGFTEPYVWNYLAPPRPAPRPAEPSSMGEGRGWPSHLYWMPLPSIVAAPFIALAEWSWGADVANDALFRAAQLTFVGLASLVPLLSYGVASLTSGLRRHALAAAILTLFSSYYFGFWSNTDAFALFGLTAGGALLVGALAARNRDRDGRLFFAAGLCAGLAHLTRADGVLVLISLAAWEIMSGKEERYKRTSDPRPAYSASGLPPPPSLFLILTGYLIIMLPWFLRNLLVAGAPLTPGGLRTAWLAEYDDLFTYPGTLLTPARYLAAGWGPILAGKWSALVANLGTLVGPQGTIVAFPFLVVGLWQLRRHYIYRPVLLYAALLFFMMTLVFTFPGSRGGYFHSGAALLPFFFPAAIVGLDTSVDAAARRLRHWQPPRARPVFTSLLVAFGIVLTGVIFWMRFIGVDWRSPRLTRADQVYAEVGKWLDKECREVDRCPIGPVVAANNPPGFYYHTGYPSIIIPNGGPQDLLAAMSAYGAQWVVLDANYPAGLAALYTAPDTEQRLVLRATFADEASQPVYVFERRAAP